MKKRFAILRWENDYLVNTQAKIPPACAVLHNFICTYDPTDNLEPWVSDHPLTQTATSQPGDIDAAKTCRAIHKMEVMAQAMWDSYKAELETRQ